MEIVIKRVGECNQCGKCCPPVCPHIQDNLCSIYDHRVEFCDECNKDHAVCLERPDLPNGIPDCGYKFMANIRGKQTEIKGLRYAD